LPRRVAVVDYTPSAILAQSRCDRGGDCTSGFEISGLGACPARRQQRGITASTPGASAKLGLAVVFLSDHALVPA